MKTADHLRRLHSPIFEARGITEQQYNVLRILRGAGSEGLPTLSVGERLIEQTPGITRLVDRLEAKQLVRRERPATDRRQVSCLITKAGLELLEQLDPEVLECSERSFRYVTKAELQALLKILEKIRDAE